MIRASLPILVAAAQAGAKVNNKSDLFGGLSKLILTGLLQSENQNLLLEHALSKHLEFSHRHKTFDLYLTDDGAIELYLDKCLRKRRDKSEIEPQYVWTNVELEWEEHHYIEVKYWASTGVLKITVNGDAIVDTTF